MHHAFQGEGQGWGFSPRSITMKTKVTVVGAGNVGATTAHWLAAMNVADVVLLDIPQMEKMPMGKALDLMQAGPVFGFDTQVVGTNDYADTKDSDVVVVTAGVPRKPGMTREDLVQTNQRIITDVIGRALAASPHAIFIVVTNPLDTMVYLALKVSGLPRERQRSCSRGTVERETVSC